jgi:D-alanyl-lipoteichoic acid acyltransferase DltB (MBOAT superfamily)
MSWNSKYAIFMLLSTIITYVSGILIDKEQDRKKSKKWVVLSIIINLMILFIFKYYTFIIDNINFLLAKIKITQIPNSLNLILPIGISFYTFQALSYTIDVYRKDTKVEKNFAKYALFVSFFPQLVAGPIEKSKNMLFQFSEEHKFSKERLHKGILTIGIGVFYKLVIADRIAPYVDMIYDNITKYQLLPGAWLVYTISTILFAFQIYFDFKAYTTIAKGSAYVLGYDLSDNFNRPYLATSIKDFWKRWHMSLTSWFKDYLYIPLGGNKKGFWRTQLNILIVFLISGLWHGAAWHFVIWGLLHAMYLILENLLRKSDKIKLKNNFIKRFITFILICFAWIFFRANSVADAITIIKKIFTFSKVSKVTFIKFDSIEFIILGIYLTIVFIGDFISTKFDLYKEFIKRNIVLRWIFYYTLIFSIIIFGFYGSGFNSQQFIYFQF